MPDIVCAGKAHCQEIRSTLLPQALAFNTGLGHEPGNGIAIRCGTNRILAFANGHGSLICGKIGLASPFIAPS